MMGPQDAHKALEAAQDRRTPHEAALDALRATEEPLEALRLLCAEADRNLALELGRHGHLPAIENVTHAVLVLRPRLIEEVAELAGLTFSGDRRRRPNIYDTGRLVARHLVLDRHNHLLDLLAVVEALTPATPGRLIVAIDDHRRPTIRQENTAS